MPSDFNTEIADAVASGGKSVDISPVAETVTPTPTPAVQEHSVSQIHEDVLNALGDSDGPPAPKTANQDKETLTLKKETKLEDTTPDPAVEDRKATTAPSDKQPDKTPYLDRFLKSDAQGNLLDKSGEIIIPAGRARTWFEAVKREGRTVRDAAARLAVSHQQITEKFRELYEHYKTLETQSQPLAQLASQLEVPEDQISDFIEYSRQYKSDPVAAIKTLLTKAQLGGIDLTKIGVNAPVAPQILRDVISEVVAKQLEPLRPKPKEGGLSSEQQEEYAAFVREFPEFIGDPNDTSEEGELRRHHENEISKAIAAKPDISLREIGLRYRLWLLEKRNEEADSDTAAPANPQSTTKYVRPRQHVVTAPQTDWAKMSFDQIAAQLKKEMNL